MQRIVLFGVGSPLVVEYVEACARLGIVIAACVRNVASPLPCDDVPNAVDADELAPEIACIPCTCPMFTPHNRIAAVADAARRGFSFASAIVHPAAVVATGVRIGDGGFVNAGAIVGARAVIGDHVVINRAASVGHHSEIGSFASIGPGATLAGNVVLERAAMIGAGAVVLPKVRVGDGAVVGAGCVVVHDVAPGSTVLPHAARAAGG